MNSDLLNTPTGKTKEEISAFIADTTARYINDLWTEFRRDEGIWIDRLKKFYKQYRGQVERKAEEGLANVSVNETLGAIETIASQEISSLFSDPQYLLMTGREATDEKTAERNQALMYYFLDEMQWKSRTIPVVRQRVTYGICAAELSWAYEKIVVPAKDGESAFKERVIKHRPQQDLIDLDDIAFDKKKVRVDEKKWVIIRKVMTYGDIHDKVRQGVYSKAQFDKIALNKAQGSTKELRDQTFEVLKYWGMVPRFWVDDGIAPESDDGQMMVPGVVEVVLDQITLRCDRNPFDHQEIPVLMAPLIQVDNQPWGLGVCEITESLQEELNEKRNQSLDHASFQIHPPLVVNKNAQIDDKELKWRPRQKIHAVETNRPAIEPVNGGGNYVEQITLDGIIKQDIRNQSGAPAPVQGIPQNKESTAFEISSLQTRGSLRISLNTEDFAERYIKRGYRLIWSMINQFVDKPLAIRIIGPDGIRWEQMSPDELSPNMDIIHKIGMDIDNRNIMRQQAIQFLTQILPYYPRANVYKLIRKVYSLFSWPDTDEVIPPPPMEAGQNVLSFEEELQVLMQGQRIDVTPFEDHLSKLSGLMQFMETHQTQMKPEAVNAIKDKMMQHQKYIEVLQMAMQAPEGQPSPGGQKQASAKDKGNTPRQSAQMMTAAGRV